MTLSVSVVIPAFNAAATLAETLQSVERQTHQPLEVFVIDDGSTDGTAEIARGFAGRIGGLKVLTVPNGGPGRARNIGARAASGELIAPLDADDIWYPTYLEKLAGRLEERGPGTVMTFAFHRRIDRQNRVLVTPFFPDIQGMAFYRLLWWAFVGTGSAFVVRRDALLAVGGFAEDRTQSDDLHGQLRLAWSGEVSAVREFLVGYRRQPGQMSAKLAPISEFALNSIAQVREEIPGADPVPFRWAIASRAGRSIGEGRIRLGVLRLFRLIWTGLTTAPLVFVRMCLSPPLGIAHGRIRHDAARRPELFLDLDPAVPGSFDLADSYFTRQFERFAEADRREEERRAAGGRWSPPKLPSAKLPSA